MAATFTTLPLGAERRGDEHRLDEARIRAYTDATNDRFERYAVLGVAPPLYAVVASATAHAGLLLGLVPEHALATTVHLGHAMEFRSALRLGSIITSRAELVETRRSPFGFSLCLQVEVYDDGGELATLSYHRVLFRGVRDGKSAGSSPPAQRVPRRGVRPLGSRTFHVAPDQSIRYAHASEDHLPIHTTREVARGAGFPDLILHGMCTLAMCAHVAVDLAGDGDPRRLHRIGATFTSPVVVDRDLVVSVGDAGGGLHSVGASQLGEPVIRDGYVTIGAPLGT